MGVLVGKIAPDFTAKAVIGGKIVNDFSLHQYRGKNVVFFFYPLDFTTVCPTELRAFQKHLKEFEKRQTQIVGCSVNSCYSHLAWLNTPVEKGGIQGIDFPLVSDFNKTIATTYDVLMKQKEVAYRGLFLIDKDGMIRHQVVNDLPFGRSVSEALRMIDALLEFEKNGEVCPDNWERKEKNIPGLE